MSDKVIIFDGIEDYEIDMLTFFQDPYIESLDEDKATELYNYTNAYSKLIRDRNTVYSNQVDLGASMLEIMIADLKYIKENSNYKTARI